MNEARIVIYFEYKCSRKSRENMILASYVFESGWHVNAVYLTFVGEN